MAQFIMRVPTMAINFVFHTIVLIIILPKIAKVLRIEIKKLGAQPENAPY